LWRSAKTIQEAWGKWQGKEHKQMKMALPTKKDVQYIKRKLKIWYEANKNHEFDPREEKKEFNRALSRVCRFFNVPLPKVQFYEKLPNALGMCTQDGQIQLLTPFHHRGSFRSYARTFFHEFGHFIYYANAEKKANEFEKRMLDRW